jgi:hypothetical protein
MACGMAVISPMSDTILAPLFEGLDPILEYRSCVDILTRQYVWWSPSGFAKSCDNVPGTHL